MLAASPLKLTIIIIIIFSVSHAANPLMTYSIYLLMHAASPLMSDMSILSYCVYVLVPSFAHLFLHLFYTGLLLMYA